MRGSIISVLLCCLVAASEAPHAERRLAAYNYQEVSKLTAADAPYAPYNDKFGDSVAINGHTVVVGAYSDDIYGGDGDYDEVSSCAGYSSCKAGAAYIFSTTDGGATYDKVAKLTASDAAAEDRFGESVAVSGGIVVVGSRYDDDAGTSSGSAYIFHTSDGGATYVEVAKLTASDAAAYDNFGFSVAIDGSMVVVGAYGDDHHGSYSGSAYVFRTIDGGATYDEVAKLTAADAAAYDAFGRSVAIDGGTIVAGATQWGNGGSGVAYVFRTSDGGATYNQIAKLMASDASADDDFGHSVAIDGATVVVGAYLDDDAGANSGSVYVFRTTDDGATYGQVAKLVSPDAEVSGNFGYSVAIDGDTIVVSSSLGWVYAFRTTNGGAAYEQVAQLIASDAGADSRCKSVAIDGNTVVAGGTTLAVYRSWYPYSDWLGSAYVFDPNRPTSQPTTSQPTTGAPTPRPTRVPTPQPSPQPTAEPTSQPTTGQPTPQPTPEPTQQQQLGLIATILICVAAAIVCACGSLAYARYVRLAKKESPSTTTADPTKLREVHGRMVSWYEGQVALRRRWGPFPTRPELLETWPGFVPVTNAFADATDGPPSTEVLPAEESAPEMLAENPPGEEEESWSARGLQRLAFWRTEDPPEEEEMRAENATTPTEEEEV